MPVFENGSIFDIAQSIKAFLNVEAGMVHGRKPRFGSRPNAAKVPGVSGESGAQARRLGLAGRWIAEQGKKLKRIRGSLTNAEVGGINPANIVWIFGAGRTGSTWLARMMEELEGYALWFEPWVGALFDPYHLRLGDRKGRHFILAPRYRKTWRRSIRNLVLDGAYVRFPEVTEDEYLVIKEPGGSIGSPLLMEALPESRMILLVRDPRDITASWLDAHREGGWRSAGDSAEASSHRAVIVAKRYLQQVGEAKRAYEAHEGRKVLVRYEELRADTLGTMKRIYSELGIPADEGELERAVKEHSWENIAEDEKGEGKFYRKAKPGGWREDLTPEQVKTVERITAPLLDELYPS